MPKFEWWSPKQGTNRIRILPDRRIVFYHFTPESYRMMPCPQLTEGGPQNTCVFCDEARRLGNRGTEEGTAAARSLRAMQRLLLPVVVRDKGRHSVKVWSCPFSIAMDIFSPEGLPRRAAPVDDLERGRTVFVHRAGGLGRLSHYATSLGWRATRAPKGLVIPPLEVDFPSDAEMWAAISTETDLAIRQDAAAICLLDYVMIDAQVLALGRS